MRSSQNGLHYYSACSPECSSKPARRRFSRSIFSKAATLTSAATVVVDPSGKFAYVANHASNDVSGYTIDPATGALTAIAGVVCVKFCKKKSR